MLRNNQIPQYLFHYYEAAGGPFRSLSEIPLEEAEAIQEQIRQAGNRFASRRAQEYLQTRRDLEQKIRNMFLAKGGNPQRLTPHYFVLGDCPWIKEWYIHGCEVRIPLDHFSPGSISFTYGDSFPAMRYQDGRPYRGIVYTLAELPALVAQYGLPQDWNPEGKLAPERYIEAQVWEDEPVSKFRNWSECETSGLL